MVKSHRDTASIKYYYARLRNFLYLSYVEWRNTCLANKRRRWTAHKLGGGGVVPLGKINQSKAIDKVSKFGSVAYVDEECAMIMYREKT